MLFEFNFTFFFLFFRQFSLKKGQRSEKPRSFRYLGQLGLDKPRLATQLSWLFLESLRQLFKVRFTSKYCAYFLLALALIYIYGVDVVHFTFFGACRVILLIWQGIVVGIRISRCSYLLLLLRVINDAWIRSFIHKIYVIFIVDHYIIYFPYMAP